MTSWEGRIESLTLEGQGVGTQTVHKDGTPFRRPVFVPWTVPGDRIRAELTDRRKKYLFGQLGEVLEESPHRARPGCPHFTECGGCNLQHVSYDEQLRQKARQIAFHLERKGVRLPYDVAVLPSGERHNYRWRARLAVRLGSPVIAGFRKHRSNEIVPVRTCFIVHRRILDFIRLLSASSSEEDAEIVVTVVVGQKGKLGLLIPLDDVERREAVKAFFEDIYARNRRLIGNVFFSLDGKVRSYGQVQEHFSYETGGMTFSFMPESFIQANVPANETLVRKCVEWTKDAGRVLDLYAGIGNLSLPIARNASTVTAVEGERSAVRAGVANAIRNCITNVHFVESAVEHYLRKAERADTVIVDPPRTGLSAAVRRRLRRMRPARLLYVSCNPVTLARDLKELGSPVREIVGVDMFPDVSHVETVVLLSPDADEPTLDAD